MTALSLATRLHVSTNMVTEQLDGELVMLDLTSETYFGLDEVSARAWQLIATRGRLALVLAELEREYDVARETLAADLLTFAERLRDKGLVTVAPETISEDGSERSEHI